MELSVDVSEIIALAKRSEAAPQHITRELSAAGRASGLAVERLAKSLIPVKTGNAKALTRMEPVQASANGVTVLVVSTAQSGTGFPYPIALEYGRKGFSATNRKVLHFVTGGKEVFTRRVGPAAARPFMQPALDRSIAFIEKQFSDAYERVLNAVGG